MPYLHQYNNESTKHCIPQGSLNQLPAIIGCGKGRNVTSAGWQITLCDPLQHVSSGRSEGAANCYTLFTFTITI